MADNVALKSDATTTIATAAADDIGGIAYQRVKLVQGADGVNDGDICAGAPLQVTLANGSVPSHAVTNSGTFAVQASIAAAQTLATVTTVGTVSTITNVVHVDDNSGSLTVDAPVGTPAFVRLSDGSAAITTLPVSLASVPSHAVTVASGGIASGAVASGAIASGAVASGAFASGALASGSIAAGAIATGATSIAANEDDASANLDTGVKVLFVQQSTPADTAGTNGDYMMPQMSAGRVWTSANVDKINAVTPLMGNGVTGTGSQRVTIASDNTAFSVNAAITAASGALASGSVASGAIASGAVASGAFASGSIAAGAIAAGATSIADNEDVASADGDRGVKVLFKRTDTPANSSGTDGDYEQPQMSAGKLWVKHVGSFVTARTQVTRPADTNAYTANDALSDSTSAPTAGGYTLTGMGRISGGSGIITDLIFGMSTAAGTSLQGELWLFDQAITNINDNAAFSISDGDRDNIVAIVPFTTSSSGTNNASAHVTGLNIGYTCVGTANLRFLVKVINAYTPASAEVFTVRAKALQID